jgi:hypothetical protein
LEWLEIYDVVSQPVIAWKWRSADSDPAGRLSLIALMLKNMRQAAVPAIIHTIAEGILGKCATRRNSTSASLADTTTMSELLTIACTTSLVSASS